MTTTIAQLIATLGLDKSDFDKGIGDAEKKGGAFSKTFNKMSLIGGGVFAAGLGAATAGVAALASSIGPASDLNESANAVNVVFTDAAGILEEYGKTAATTVGLSTANFNQLSSVTGAFLTNLGFTNSAAADETIKLTERAADMASVFNTDVSSALAAIQSGLKGEFNPLEQFGVKLNAATIEAKALQMGLAANKSELTDSMKAQAALSLIYEQTNKVAGDFKNTSDGVANGQRILASTLENIRARIGAGLLPAISKLGSELVKIASSQEFQQFLDSVVEKISNFSTFLVDRIPQWINNFKTFVDWLSNNKAIVVGVLAALGVAATAWGITTAIAAATAIAPFLPVIAIMAAIGAAAYVLYRAWNENWGGIQQRVQAVWTFLQPVFEQIKNVLSVVIPIAVKILQMYINNAMTSFRFLFEIGGKIISVFQFAANIIGAVFGLAVKATAGFIQNILIPPIRSMYEWINAKVIPVVNKLASWLSSKLTPAFNAIGNAIGNVIGWLSNLASSISNVHLPSWLTPGSPTPFEIGLLGIADALKTVNRIGFAPDFSADNFNPTKGMRNVSTGNTVATVPNNYQITINNPKSEESEESVRKSLKRLSYLGVVS